MSDTSPNNTDRRITALGVDVAVIKSQVADIRVAQQAMNIKLDNMSAYTRNEADDKFASAQDVANLRYLIYTIIGGVVAFFFYIIQAKVV